MCVVRLTDGFKVDEIRNGTKAVKHWCHILSKYGTVWLTVTVLYFPVDRWTSRRFKLHCGLLRRSTDPPLNHQSDLQETSPVSVRPAGLSSQTLVHLNLNHISLISHTHFNLVPSVGTSGSVEVFDPVNITMLFNFSLNYLNFLCVHICRRKKAADWQLHKKLTQGIFNLCLKNRAK